MCSGRTGEGANLAIGSIYLSLGANLGDRRMRIEQGIASLEQGGFHVQQRSSLYETEPVDYERQPWFLNMVVAGETNLSPRGLLALCQHIENRAGRTRDVRFGPRPLDIDILLYRQQVIDELMLQVPHPRMYERRFVLVPLLEIAPQLCDPLSDEPFAKILARLDEKKKVKKLTETEF